MNRKLKPHHDLARVKAKFATVETLVITGTALRGARGLGYGLEEIVEVVQVLKRGDFVKSETAHSPPNPRVWHDTYVTQYDARDLYLKFAGETLVDVSLVSFKEASNG